MRVVGRMMLVGLAAVVIAACGGGDDETVRDADGNVVEGGEIGVFSLNVGDCFLDLPVGEVSSIEAVPCAEEHKYEIYHLFDLDLPEFDQTAVSEGAQEGCYDAFEGYMGVSYEESFYNFDGLQPTDGSWSQGDREVVCLATPFDGRTTTGTAKGANLLLQDALGADDADALGADDAGDEAMDETTTTTAPAEDTTTTEAVGGTQSVFDLSVGECYVDIPQADIIETVEAISCDEPHGIEIYHVFDLDLPAFDSAAVSDAAQTGCYDAFEGYMGISYEESWYGFDGLLPTDQSWAAGDREVVCFVAPYDPDITESVGSAQGQGRTLGE